MRAERKPPAGIWTSDKPPGRRAHAPIAQGHGRRFSHWMHFAAYHIEIIRIWPGAIFNQIYVTTRVALDS